VLHGRTEHEAGVLCGGFDFDEVRFFVFLCVGLRFLCELSVAGCARFACGIVGLATIDMTSGGWRILLSLQGRAVRGCLVRLVSSVGLLFQPEKSSWFFVPTCFGGLIPLLDISSQGQSQPKMGIGSFL